MKALDLEHTQLAFRSETGRWVIMKHKGMFSEYRREKLITASVKTVLVDSLRICRFLLNFIRRESILATSFRRL